MEPPAAPLHPARPGWGRMDWACAALLGALAVALRSPFLGAPAYGDEGMHYYMAKHLLAAPANFSDVFGQTWFHPSWIVWQRPLYYLAFHPAALASFAAFRVQNLALGALLPVVAYGLLRQHRHSRLAALGAGVACAALPYLAVWGTFGLMDTGMTVLLLAGLWARAAGRPVLSACLLLAAVWTKETAYVAVAALWAATHLGRWRRREAPLWPLQMDRCESALAVALLVGLWPLMVAFSHGLQTPGGVARGPTTAILEQAFWSSWFVPVLLVGLRWRASRWACAWALGAGGFLLALHGLLHRAVEIWYDVPAVALTAVAVFATLDAAWGALGHSRPWAPAAGSLAIVALLAAGALVPDSAAKSAWMHPFHSVPSGGWADSVRYETQVRDQDLVQLEGWVQARPFSTLMLLDVEYPHALQSFIDRLPHVLGGGSGWFELLPHPLAPVAHAIEANGTLLVIQALDTPYNHAMRDVYSDCVVERNPTYLVVDGPRCPGRAALLEQRIPYPHP